MALTDRFPMRALRMAGLQVVCFLGLLLYAASSPAAGTRVLCPLLTMLASFGALIAITLTRPWESGASFGMLAKGKSVGAVGFGGHHPRRWLNFDGVLLWLATLMISAAQLRVLAEVKLRVAQLARLDPDADPWSLPPSDLRAWADDAVGFLAVSGEMAVPAIAVPLLFLGMLWWLLPR